MTVVIRSDFTFALYSSWLRTGPRDRHSMLLLQSDTFSSTLLLLLLLLSSSPSPSSSSSSPFLSSSSISLSLPLPLLLSSLSLLLLSPRLQLLLPTATMSWHFEAIYEHTCKWWSSIFLFVLFGWRSSAILVRAVLLSLALRIDGCRSPSSTLVSQSFSCYMKRLIFCSASM